MKKRKIIAIGLFAAALLGIFLYSGLSFSRAAEKAKREASDTFIKDGNEILTPSQWVDRSLREIIEIKPGMKRADLKKLFAPDGGISSRIHGRYLYRSASIKIDVEFEPAGKVERDAQGRILVDESDDDVIKTVSKPYLEYGFTD